MLAHPSILLIEDSPGECELFRAALALAGPGIALSTEPDPDVAYHMLETLLDTYAALPSLILLDLKLGKQHGLDLLRRLRGNSRTRHLPIIVFTTSDDPADPRRLLRGGSERLCDEA